MADDKLRIIIEAVDKASAELAKVKKEVDGLGGETKKSTGFLENMGKAMLGLNQGLELAGKLARVAVKAFEFGEAGRQIENAEARLAAFVGGAANAEKVITEMRNALDNSITSFEAAQGASKLFELGLAKTGTEAAELTAAINATGGNLEDFTLMLANESYRRLDLYGIGVSAVKDRMEELRKENETLTTQEAFAIATKEELIKKMEVLEDAGYQAVTAYDRLKAGVSEFTDEMKKNVNEGIEPTVSALADLTDEMLKSRKVLETIRYAEEQGLDVGYDLYNLYYDLGKSGDVRNQAEAAYAELLRITNARMSLLNSTAPKTLDFFAMYAPAVQQAAEATDEFAESTVNAEALQTALNGSLDEQIANLEDMKQKYADLSEWEKSREKGKQLAEDIADAEAKVNEELKEMVGNSIVLGMLESGLEGAAEAAYDIALNMGLIDQTTYNANLTAQNFDEYLATASEQGIKDYGLAAKWLADNVDRLQDKTFTVTQIIDIIYRNGLPQFGEGSYGGGGATSTIGQLEVQQGVDINGNGIIGSANGFSGIVPPGYPNDSFLQTFALTSGEHVQVTPAGGSSNNGANITVVINTQFAPDNEDAVYRAVRPAVQRAYREIEASRGY